VYARCVPERSSRIRLVDSAPTTHPLWVRSRSRLVAYCETSRSGRLDAIYATKNLRAEDDAPQILQQTRQG
jgi:hypothetical protein